jgi:diadenosine tetraphosphate (Ap4A) HIT family hydrolase
MNSHTIWESELFRITHSRDYRLPGYLFVENCVDASNLNSFPPNTQGQLGEALRLAEYLVRKFASPERVYILKFGESDDRVHFHVIPRTRKLLDAYLSCEKDEAPFNGALITAWLWKNADRLDHNLEEVNAFVQSARTEVAT